MPATVTHVNLVPHVLIRVTIPTLVLVPMTRRVSIVNSVGKVSTTCYDQGEDSYTCACTSQYHGVDCQTFGEGKYSLAMVCYLSFGRLESRT